MIFTHLTWSERLFNPGSEIGTIWLERRSLQPTNSKTYMLPPQTLAQLEQRLDKLLDHCQIIEAAVIATVDGHLCAMKQRGLQYTLERLAVMGSTLMSLGDTITAELQMGNCDNIISENKNGIVAFMHITKELVLVTLTAQKTALGMLLSHTRMCAEDLGKQLGN